MTATIMNLRLVKKTIINIEDDNKDIPHEYMFKSFMAYVMWGPFAEESKKLLLFLLGE